MKFLSYDSKFSQIIIKLCRCCYLNLLWLLCSLPIFTLGAATTALYSVTLKMVREEEGNITRQFFKSFRENFKQSTVLWLILLILGLCLVGDGYILIHLRSSSTGAPAVFWTLLLALIIGAAIAYAILLIYVFPLVASVYNTNLAMVKNALLIGTHYLFCTILVFAIHLVAVVICVRFFTPFLIFGEGLCALLSSYLLSNVIRACSHDPDQTQISPEEGV